MGFIFIKYKQHWSQPFSENYALTRNMSIERAWFLEKQNISPGHSSSVCIAANTQQYKTNIAKSQHLCYNDFQTEEDGTIVNDLGFYLKELRNNLHLSLKDVHEHCGVTDSKLSRLERGEGRDFSPLELKKLAQLYGVNVIPLYIKAGYLDESDLSEYQLLFENANLLNEEEHSSIQTQINLLTKGRQVSDNDF